MNVPDAQADPLRGVLQSLLDLHLKVQAVSQGHGATGFEVPALEKTLTDSAKKYQTLFALAAKLNRR